MKNKATIRKIYTLVKGYRTAICSVYPEVCPYCLKRIRPLETACFRCAEKFPEIRFDRRAHGGFPVSCAFPYIEPYDEAIKNFKFHKYKQFAPQLGAKLAESVKGSFKGVSFEYITYVPLHPEREKERGYNQSKLIAREISYILEIPLKSTLVKIKNNPPQHETDRKHKAENVKNVYKVCDKKLVEGKRILLVDDIITTGHTLGECGRMLKLAGASEIFCCTFATAVEKRLEMKRNL